MRGLYSVVFALAALTGLALLAPAAGQAEPYKWHDPYKWCAVNMAAK